MPGTPESAVPETILAFDYGERRIGVAVGQSVTGSATPVATLTNGDAGPDWEGAGKLVREWAPGRLLVGMPIAADGSPTPMTARAQAFARQLERYGLPVTVVDERYSSLEARQRLVAGRRLGMRGRIGKGAVDAAAAALIAERWLQEQAGEQSRVDRE